MTSTSFRESMNSMGWSRRDPDIPANTNSSTPFLSMLQSYNPFGNSGYVSLPTTEGPGAPLPAPSRREEEEGWFACESSIPRFRLSFNSISFHAQVAISACAEPAVSCIDRCLHTHWCNACSRLRFDHSWERAASYWTLTDGSLVLQ